MGSIANADRRDPHAPRRPFQASVTFSPSAARGALRADAVDMSSTGMLLRGDEVPDVGETLAFRFRLDDGRDIDARCEVVWSQAEDGRSGAFGVRFTAEPSSSRPASPRAEERVRLHLDGMDAPFRAKVRGRDEGTVVVGHELSFLKIGARVVVEGREQEHGVLRAVDVEVDAATRNPRLMLTVDLDGYSRRLPLGDVIDAPAQAQPVVVATVAAAAPEAPAPVVAAVVAPTPAPIAAAPAVKPAPAKPTETAHEGPEITAGEPDAPALRTEALDGADDEAFDDEMPPTWLQRTVGSARAAVDATRRAAVPFAANLAKSVRKGAGEMRAKLARRDDVAASTEAPRNGLRPQHAQVIATASDPDGTVTQRRNRKVVLGALAGTALTVVVLAVAIGGAPTPAQPHPTVPVTTDTTAAVETPLPTAAPAVPAIPAAADTATPAEEPAPQADSRVVAATGSMPADLQGAAISNAAQVEDNGPVVVQNRRPAFAPAITPALRPRLVRPAAAVAATPAVRGATFGNPAIRVGTHLALRMDGPVGSITGAGTRGNAILLTVPGRRSLDLAAQLARLDGRILNAGVMNRAAGAELTLRFREAAPPFFAHARGNVLEVVLGAPPSGPARRVAAPLHPAAVPARPAVRRLGRR